MNYYKEANKKSGKTGENLLRILETRLDNVVYRAGFAKSRDHARQLVRHGHIAVNGTKTDIPSARVAANDVIEVRQKSKALTPFQVAQGEAGERTVPAWLEAIPSRLRILVHNLPERPVIDTISALVKLFLADSSAEVPAITASFTPALSMSRQLANLPSSFLRISGTSGESR